MLGQPVGNSVHAVHSRERAGPQHTAAMLEAMQRTHMVLERLLEMKAVKGEETVIDRPFRCVCLLVSNAAAALGNEMNDTVGNKIGSCKPDLLPAPESTFAYILNLTSACASGLVLS